MGKHLTYNDRLIIEKGIHNGSDKASIARTLGKDKSTISLEIRKYRVTNKNDTYNCECKNYALCKFGRKCSEKCVGYQKFTCKRRDRSPGACNGCGKMRSCHYIKYTYSAERAENIYKTTLSEAREGFNLSEEELDQIAKVIVQLLKNGNSPYTVLASHPECNISEKTLYTYIESGLFKKYGVDSFTLRRQVNRKVIKQKNTCKKRSDRKFLIGRTYKDYLNFIDNNPNVFLVEMDTVYNDKEKGPFLQTFKIVKAGFTFAIYHDEFSSLNMTKGVSVVKDLISPMFNRYKVVILTDRGSEFSKPEEMEKDEKGDKVLNVFYCNPLSPYQKASLENNHIELRYILPKQTDLRKIGLTNQNAINKVCSNINSFKKERLDDKTPWELLRFYYPDVAKKMISFGISEIPGDHVVLLPQALK